LKTVELLEFAIPPDLAQPNIRYSFGTISASSPGYVSHKEVKSLWQRIALMIHAHAKFNRKKLFPRGTNITAVNSARTRQAPARMSVNAATRTANEQHGDASRPVCGSFLYKIAAQTNRDIVLIDRVLQEACIDLASIRLKF
jgi:hypothetical protein